MAKLRLVLAVAAATLAALLQAQPLPATGTAAAFAEGSARPSGTELAGRLAGNVFVATLANGATWRMDYKSSAGYVFFDISNGARDTARWRTDEGQVCYQFQRVFPSGCIDYRILNDTLYFKRTSGEIVALQKK